VKREDDAQQGVVGIAEKLKRHTGFGSAIGNASWFFPRRGEAFRPSGSRDGINLQLARNPFPLHGNRILIEMRYRYGVISGIEVPQENGLAMQR